MEEGQKVLNEEKQKLEDLHAKFNMQAVASQSENTEALQTKLTEVEQKLAQATEERMRAQAEMSKVTQDVQNLTKQNAELQSKIDGEQNELTFANAALRSEMENLSKRSEELQVLNIWQTSTLL